MSLRVLYIEDNPFNMRLVSHILRMHNHTMLEAFDGYDGIKLAIREQPDVILLDIHLVGINGFEVMSRLRTLPMVADIPIVAITADATLYDKSYFIASGFDNFIAKPVAATGLISVITQLCSQPALAQS